MIKPRNQSLDIAKGLGIILVVFGHNWTVLHEKGELFRIIFSFHVPLFFFLSGVFLSESSTFKQFAISRMHSLLKPYFVILLFVGAYKLIIQAIKVHGFPSIFFDYIKGIFYATGKTIEWTPLWFLPHLFVVSCIAFLIIKFITSNMVKLFFSLCSLVAGFMLLSPTNLPWSIDLLPISLSFLLVGYIFRNIVKSIKFNLGYFTLSMTCFSLLHLFFNETMDLNLRLYGNFFISTFQALLGIYICLSLSSFLANYVTATKIIGYIGSGTLFILIFHSFFQGKTFEITMKIIDQPYLPGIASLIAGVIFPLIIWELAKKNIYLTAAFLPQKK